MHWPLVQLVLLGSGLAASSLAAQNARAGADTTALAHGKRLFDAQCARCHGIDGSGGMGPRLARPSLRHAPDSASLIGVIQDGIPGTGMRGAWQMTEEETVHVATYVRSLARASGEVVPGDAARGRAAYERSACASCHMVRGVGGAVGPDLTEVGIRRGASYLRESIVEPAASLPLDEGDFIAYLPVRIVPRRGPAVRGVRVNEDPFSIQIRDLAGRYHSFDKRDLQRLDYERGTSLMPTYRGRLSATELEDLVTYLASLGREP